jgi:hypothetical protein
MEKEGQPMVPRQLVMGLLAMGIIALAMGTDVRGQYVPYYSPVNNRYANQGPVSPYLNLLRGTNPAVNYYLGVRSEVERRSALQLQLLGQERTTQEFDKLSDELYQKLPGTGHPAAFMNYGGYYSFGGTPGGQLAPGLLGSKFKR